MNEHDAELYAEEKGLEDGARGTWAPPFNRSYAYDLQETYEVAWWHALAVRTVEEEFPNG